MHNVSSAAGIQSSCTGCGKCRAVCPAGIDIPAIIQLHGQRETRFQDTAEPVDCIECGACSACCPEEIPVKELMRELAMGQCRQRGQPASV